MIRSDPQMQYCRIVDQLAMEGPLNLPCEEVIGPQDGCMIAPCKLDKAAACAQGHFMQLHID